MPCAGCRLLQNKRMCKHACLEVENNCEIEMFVFYLILKLTVNTAKTHGRVCVCVCVCVCPTVVRSLFI